MKLEVRLEGGRRLGGEDGSQVGGQGGAEVTEVCWQRKSWRKVRAVSGKRCHLRRALRSPATWGACANTPVGGRCGARDILEPLNLPLGTSQELSLASPPDATPPPPGAHLLLGTVVPAEKCWCLTWVTDQGRFWDRLRWASPRGPGTTEARRKGPWCPDTAGEHVVTF